MTAMKNADDMLKSIVKKLDTSGDGKIQYEGWSDGLSFSEESKIADAADNIRVPSLRRSR